jgi:hypothetical protein
MDAAVCDAKVRNFVRDLGTFVQLGVIDDPWPGKLEEPGPTG